MKHKQFTIKRSEWGRSRKGRAAIGTLFNPRTRTMCCLGFFSNQVLGIPKEAMAYKSTPLDLEYGTEEDRLVANAVAVPQLIRLNDREDECLDLDDAEQEQPIAETFRAAGFDVVYED